MPPPSLALECSASVRPSSSTATAVSECLCTSTPIAIIDIASLASWGDRRADRPQSRQAAKLLSGHARRSREGGGDTTLASQPSGDMRESSQPPPPESAPLSGCRHPPRMTLSAGMSPERRSGLVLDLRLSGPLRCLECGPHGLELLRRMTGPVDKLANDTQGLTATEGLGWIPRELLVGQVRVVLEVPGGLDDVDARAVLAAGELGTPDRGVERSGEVDVVHHPARLEVRFAPRDK